jgi:2,3-bisphosphoglycerate-independent phosphoglycerate mutase
MDEMAKTAEQGIAHTVPANLPAGSDVANWQCLDMIHRSIFLEDLRWKH